MKRIFSFLMATLLASNTFSCFLDAITVVVYQYYHMALEPIDKIVTKQKAITLPLPEQLKIIKAHLTLYTICNTKRYH